MDGLGKKQFKNRWDSSFDSERQMESRDELLKIHRGDVGAGGQTYLCVNIC